jgi:hypothetical protein
MKTVNVVVVYSEIDGDKKEPHHESDKHKADRDDDWPPDMTSHGLSSDRGD